MTLRLRLSREARREQIVTSAIETFARRGFHGTRMEDVARDARVNIALVYQHFPDKQALYNAIFAVLYADNPMIWKLSELMHKKDDHEVFSYVAKQYVTLSERDVAIHRLLLFAALEQPELYQRHFRERESNVVEMLTRYISERIADGVFHAVDAGLTARLFSAQVFVYLLEARVIEGRRWEGYAEKEVLTAIVTTFLQGLHKR